MDFAPARVAASDRLTDGLDHRLFELWELTGDDALRQLVSNQTQPSTEATSRHMTPEQRLDLISTTLMNCFKNTSQPKVFAMLFELNHDAFLHAVQMRLRRSGLPIDAHDVVQEVFLNIYRYPYRFVPDRVDAFRNWGHRIVRNTLLKFLKAATRSGANLSLEDSELQPADPGAVSPLRNAQNVESARLADTAYLIYLNFYLVQFQQLAPKERRALTLVEVEGLSYKAAADALGIRLENLKMVIFRGRRKILRGMAAILEHLAAPGVARA